MFTPGGGGGGALAGKLCTDARTKDYKKYPKHCIRHFEIDTPFHCVQSESNRFPMLSIKKHTSATFVYCTDAVYIGKILHFSRSSVTTRHHLSQRFSKHVNKTIPFSYKNSIFPTLNDDSAVHCPARKNYLSHRFFVHASVYN